jgi:hypothetical protein
LMQGDYGCRSVVSQWNRSYRFRWLGAASCFQHDVAPLCESKPQTIAQDRDRGEANLWATQARSSIANRFAVSHDAAMTG